MLIINLTQGGDKWLEWRSDGEGASEMAIILGLSPYMTPKQLWSIKIGVANPPDLSCNPHVIRGKRNEPKARLAMEQWLGGNVMLLPICAEHSKFSFIKSSYDGLDLNRQSSCYNTPVELKCPSETVFKEIAFYGNQSIHYKMYACQVQQQMFVCGATKGYLAFYHKGQLIPFVIQRDDDFLREAIPKVCEFHRCVQALKPPKDDLEKDVFIPSGETLIQWTALAEKYKTLLEKKRVDPDNAQVIHEFMETKARLANLTGGYKKGAAAGIQVTNVIVGGNVNQKLRLDAILRYLREQNVKLPSHLNEDQFTSIEKKQIRVSFPKNQPTQATNLQPNNPQHRINLRARV